MSKVLEVFDLVLILAMVDYRKRIVDLEIGWPGSVGDGRIWNCSELKKVYKDWLSQMPTTSLMTGVQPNGDVLLEDVPPFILADSAYSNTRHMVTTYKTTEILANDIVGELNKRLGGARYHVENAFGILKARFQIFKQALECSHEDIRLAITLTSSIIILHNFLIEVNDDLTDAFEPVIENEHGGEDNNGEVEEEDISTRAILFRYVRLLKEQH